jgi:hypothetical protein
MKIFKAIILTGVIKLIKMLRTRYFFNIPVTVILENNINFVKIYTQTQNRVHSEWLSRSRVNSKLLYYAFICTLNATWTWIKQLTFIYRNVLSVQISIFYNIRRRGFILKIHELTLLFNLQLLQLLTL